ncbi:DUF998 domain-containing protein [Pseudarthrobacter sp. Fe7]|nr:DUF998 domain-containing protein [Pseudarthrobacter sp. Fe7]
MSVAGGRLPRRRRTALSESQHSDVVRICLLAAGPLSSLLYVVFTDGIAASQWPGYRRTEQMVSELFAVGSPARDVLVTFGWIYTVLFTAFGLGVWSSVRGNRALRIGAGLLMAYGLWNIMGALFPLRLGDDASIPMHIVATNIQARAHGRRDVLRCRRVPRPDADLLDRLARDVCPHGYGRVHGSPGTEPRLGHWRAHQHRGIPAVGCRPCRGAVETDDGGRHQGGSVMTYVRDLGDVQPGDIAGAGGKAVGLGGLIRAGLPVPPGFVLTTNAYADFVAENNLGQAVQELAGLSPEESPQEYEHASALIRTLFSKGSIPADIEAELKAAYEQLGGGETAVSVRSSATAEDLASASFAGQQESYLNIRGLDALATAVINCWASLWTARAMAYRARAGVLPDQVRLAVVIQQMVEADAAGVMFTANPANGRRDQAVISAAWGLGEAVVSGQVTTDDLTVDTETGKVLTRQTADKDVMTVPTENGTAEEKVAEARRRAPVLDDAAAAEVAGYGRRIADHFGAPQDIEWARAGGRFFLLQSRPITALPEPAADTPTEWPVPYPKGLYFRASIVEHMPEPLSPLFADLIDGSVSRSLSALMNQALGPGSLRDGDVHFPTVNGYAYYYYRTWPMLRMTGRTLPAMRALFGGKAHMGVAGWRDYSHPRYERIIKDWSVSPPAEPARRPGS